MISLLVPTRGRPANVARFLGSAAATARTPRDVEVVFYVDDDDPARDQIADAVLKSGGEIHTTLLVGPRIVLSECWNHCWKACSGEILGLFGDDIVFRTADWDSEVDKAFREVNDKILFVHGRDGIAEAVFGTHGFIHQRWANTVGYFVPPYFSSDFSDTWLNDIANAIGRRRYLGSVYTEHMHPCAGKAETDRTHLERMARGVRDQVSSIYVAKAPERERDANLLRGLMLSP